MPNLSRIELLSVDRQTVLEDVSWWYQRIERRRRRTREHQLRLRLLHDGGGYLAAHTQRRCLDFHFEDGSVEPWRIAKVESDEASPRPSEIRCQRLFLDAKGVVAQRTHPTGMVDLRVMLSGMTLEEALQKLLHGGYGAPDWLRLGSIESAIAEREVDVRGTNAHFLEIIRALCLPQQGDCEYTMEWQADASASLGGYYLLSFMRRIGDQDPTGRLVEIGNNADRLRRRPPTEGYFSAVSPTGLEDVTVGEAFWEVLAQSGSTVELDRGAVVVDGFGTDGLYLGNEAEGFYAVTDSRTALTTGSNDEVDLASAPGFSGRVRWALDAAGTELTYIADPNVEAGYGRVVRPVAIREVIPFENLLAEGGVSANLERWQDYEGPPSGGGGGGAVLLPDFSFTVSGTSVTFDAREDAAFASYAWNFGDGNTATGPNPTHDYGADGTWLVRLTVTYTNGTTFNVEKEVETAADGSSDGSASAQLTLTSTEGVGFLHVEAVATASTRGDYALEHNARGFYETAVTFEEEITHHFFFTRTDAAYDVTIRVRDRFDDSILATDSVTVPMSEEVEML